MKLTKEQEKIKKVFGSRSLIMYLLEERQYKIMTLAKKLGMSNAGMHEHIGILEQEGYIKVNRRMGKKGCEIRRIIK